MKYAVGIAVTPSPYNGWTGRCVNSPGPGRHLCGGFDVADRTCSEPGCDAPVRGRGLCAKHYTRLVRHGDVHAVRPNRKSPEERFFAKVHTTSTCWLWTAYTNPDGYGQFGETHGQGRLAHRWAYEHLVGPIPAGMQLDHLCRVRHCVNPSHLEPVTQRENLMRGEGVTTKNAAKTHCVHGHPFDEANTYAWRGRRACRTCRDARNRRRGQR